MASSSGGDKRNNIVALTRDEDIQMIIEYWMRNTMENNQISIRDIVGMVIDYYNKSEILRWSTTYICSELNLSQNNEIVTRKQRQGSSQIYARVTIDSEPVFEGVHCWRIKVENMSI